MVWAQIVAWLVRPAGARRGFGVKKKNLFNKWVRSRFPRQTHGSSPGMKKPGPLPFLNKYQ